MNPWIIAALATLSVVAVIAVVVAVFAVISSRRKNSPPVRTADRLDDDAKRLRAKNADAPKREATEDQADEDRARFVAELERAGVGVLPSGDDGIQGGQRRRSKFADDLGVGEDDT